MLIDEVLASEGCAVDIQAMDDLAFVGVLALVAGRADSDNEGDWLALLDGSTAAEIGEEEEPGEQVPIDDDGSFVDADLARIMEESGLQGLREIMSVLKEADVQEVEETWDLEDPAERQAAEMEVGQRVRRGLLLLRRTAAPSCRRPATATARAARAARAFWRDS